MNNIIESSLNWFNSLDVLQMVILLVGVVVFLFGIVKIFRKTISEGVLIVLFAVVYTALFLYGFNAAALMVKHLLIIFAVSFLLFIVTTKLNHTGSGKIPVFLGISVASFLLGSRVICEIIEADETRVMYFSVLIPLCIYQVYAMFKNTRGKKTERDGVDTSPSDIVTTWNPNHK